ncbi:MAG: hypothetical protein EPN21_10375 [Methylococcaceae bacterium]|nr:MAG: hypothetical protein EPN21_10375 [Methylococcaceae bacterium]
MAPWRRCIYLLLLCLSQALPAAPKQESGAQQALKKAQGVIRQLTDEKRALETEKSALQEQVNKLEGIAKQVEPLQGELQRHKAGADSLRSANQALESQLSGEREQVQGLHRKLQEIVATAKLIQNDNGLLVAAVREREQWIAQCSGKNRQLLETNQALLEQYQNKGVWDSLAELEPVTGIAKVDTQNAVESYQFKLEDLQATR